MNNTEKLEYIKRYQLWRRGSDDVPAPDPATLGHVIDYAIECCERCEQMDAMNNPCSLNTTTAKTHSL